jgi:hypothetical protein
MMRALAITTILASALGCSASPVEVRRSATPADAPRLAPRLRPSAILRGAQRTPIPADAAITPSEVVIDTDTSPVHVHKLMPGDVIETDEDGRILAVRSSNGTETRFAPGTATSPSGSDVVRGKLSVERRAIALGEGDRIEVTGTFAPGEKVPGGGHITSTGLPAFVVLGLVTFAVGYAPAFYVGATSALKADRVLLLPVLGPWIDLGTRPSCTTDQNIFKASGLDTCAPENAAKAGLIAAGAFEALGTLLFLVGLPSRAVFVEDLRTGLRIEPILSPNSAAVVGHF